MKKINQVKAIRSKLGGKAVEDCKHWIEEMEKMTEFIRIEYHFEPAHESTDYCALQ